MKKVIVTGDSGDLGRSIILTLLKNGYAVIGISRSFNDKQRAIQNEFGPSYNHINTDLALPGKIKDIYLKELKPVGPIYGLINNAAHPYDDIITNANLTQLEKMFKINVISPIILTKYILRDMLLHETKGVIIHVSSVSAHTGYKGLSMYASTKGALEAFSRTTAREWGSKGIRSNCVAPGFMETQMSSTLDDDQKERIYNRTSLKSATEIQSVSNTVEFLLSEKSKSVTGTTIMVDSGTI